MKKGLILIMAVIFVLCLNLNSYSWSMCFSSNSHGEEINDSHDDILEVVLERHFEEPVVDTIYDEVEMTVEEAKKLGINGLGVRSPEEKIRVKYPRVLFIGDPESEYKKAVKTIKFFNIKGKLLNEINDINLRCIQFPIYSPNKKVIGIIEYRTLLIYDLNGKMISKAGIPEFGYFKLADNGSVISYENSIVFYNPKGEVLKIIPGLSLFHYGKLTPDSQYFLILTMGKNLKYESTEYYSTNLSCYDLKGNLVWQYHIEEMSSKGILSEGSPCDYKTIEISEDSQKIIIRGYSIPKKSRRQWIFDINGKLIEKKEGY